MTTVHNLTVFSDVYETNPNITLKEYCELHEQRLKEQNNAKLQAVIEQNRKLNKMTGKTFLINHNNSAFHIFYHDTKVKEDDTTDKLMSSKPILNFVKGFKDNEQSFRMDTHSIQKSWLFPGPAIKEVTEVSVALYNKVIKNIQEIENLIVPKK